MTAVRVSNQCASPAFMPPWPRPSENGSRSDKDGQDCWHIAIPGCVALGFLPVVSWPRCYLCLPEVVLCTKRGSVCLPKSSTLPGRAPFLSTRTLGCIKLLLLILPHPHQVKKTYPALRLHAGVQVAPGGCMEGMHRLDVFPIKGRAQVVLPSH